VAVVGIGGYGHHYLKALWDEVPQNEACLVAVVEPFPENAPLSFDIKQAGIPLFSQLDELFASGIDPDLVVIASPIHEHVPQSIAALEHGCCVLCDKPLAATVQAADLLIRAVEASGRRVLIGYQWSFSTAVQELKEKIRRGDLGRPVRFKSLCLWPRDLAYYQRNDWAGRIRDRRGRWVLDSPANNAMAHFLHNLLYLLGDRADTSAEPAEVTAEAYRVFPIENFDSVACRILTRAGTELLFYASHAVPEAAGPVFHLQFEDAEAVCGEAGGEIICRNDQGLELNLGSPESDHQFKKLSEAVRLAAGSDETGNEASEPVILCGPEAARAQTVCVNGIQDSMGDITDLPRSLARKTPDNRVWIEGLSEAFKEAYQRGVLPSEAGTEWARRGKTVDVRDYVYFPGGSFPRGSKDGS
jgi:predicted dehydrogenase